MSMTSEFTPNWASPPGETVLDIISSSGLKLEELAHNMNISAPTLRNLIEGKERISSDYAAALEKSIGGSAAFWVRRDQQYKQALNRLDISRQRDIEWLEQLPLTSMTKMNWIHSGRKIEEKIRNCLNFFDVDSSEEWYTKYENKLVSVAFRTSQSYNSTPESIVTWLRMGEIISKSNNICADWDKILLKNSLNKIRDLSREKNPEIFIPEVTNILKDSGVSFVLLKTPQKCSVSGATYFLDSKPILLMSGRHLSEDHFWFTLFHEIGHLILHSNEERIFVEDPSFHSEEESEANYFAQNILVPQSFQDELRNLSYKQWRKIPRFAKKIGVSAGIIVGQLQHLKIIEHRHLNKLKVKFRWSTNESILKLKQSTSKQQI